MTILRSIRNEIECELNKHTCSKGDCAELLTAFVPFHTIVLPVEHEPDHVGFPPKPPSHKLENQIISDFCNDTSPKAFMESGCMVCGELHVINAFSELLINNVATRKERNTSDDPIDHIPGPVLDSNSTAICEYCEGEMLKGGRPKNALANGLWIGDIPDVLKGLTYAEKILIARIRHNACVVRVASGCGKLDANAIMFANPSVKIYHKLPPSIEELNEVLAIVFLGPVIPTDELWKRTPIQENLNSYSLSGIPVTVDWKQTGIDESNINTQATSVHNDEIGIGTDQGPSLKARALKHIATDGVTLGVGHDINPQSIYDNPQAYPGMFPWLFPYGYGGFRNGIIEGKFGEISHKRHLLMYHDKCFQVDLYFPLIAFNHEQIKSSTTGGFLLAKPVLSDISERMIGGEQVKPETDEEKKCFDILQDLDHTMQEYLVIQLHIMVL
ncbi:hypothetical protein BDZ94DRAFT_1286152 [Collybia nuda]|uniref:DUF6570 domain-containing protein n=1 Tax=Collybia nuda TaxID=64659 RepID=A0A9P6CBS1_9AGAR|nr:hypothetical protein BDZ94DRAFT_1286152 [Collybia nuda]